MRTTNLAALALLIVPAPAVNADSSAVMTDMLNIYTNTTDAQILDTQRRGGITLGRLSARTEIASPNLIAYQPPSIQGGCNGIDLYGGSFSFINKDEMTQALRAIASNAVSYAFTLAMESVCPSCMQKMESLRDKVDEINGMVRDSCHWATSLVDETGLKEVRDERIAAARGQLTQSGGSQDAAEAEIEGGNSLHQIDQALGTVDAVNVVWVALQQGDMASWFTVGGDDALMEVVMSLTGTLMKTEERLDIPGAECSDDALNREYCFQQLPSLLTVEEFIEGSAAGVELYRCGIDPDCLSPSKVTEADWDGFADLIEEILFGSTLPPDGLLYKLRAGNVPLTAAEQAFLTTAAGPVRDILDAAVISEGTLRSVGGILQDTLASILARQMVMELIFLVERAFDLQDIQMEVLMRDRLTARQNEFATRTAETALDMQMLNNLFTVRQQVAEQMARMEEAPTLE